MKINSIDKNSTIEEKIEVVYYIPVFFSALTVILLFFLVRRFTNDIYAYPAPETTYNFYITQKF